MPKLRNSAKTDLKFGLEQSIKDIDQQIKEIIRNAKIAPTLAEKLSWPKQQQELERARNKQRKELFYRQDEVDERRETLIGQTGKQVRPKNSSRRFIYHPLEFVITGLAYCQNDKLQP
jgi:hypothetical protein